MSEINYRLATDEDISSFLAIYNRLYQTNRSEEAFRWEFRECPHGEGFHVLAESDGKVVGMQAIIPIRFSNQDGEILTGKSEDTLVDPSQRGKGIFEGMYQLIFSECRRRGIQFIWGYTTAIKPFKGIGFDVPFHHGQSLAVFTPSKAANYLISLDPSASFSKKLKVKALAWASFMKQQGKRSKFKVTEALVGADIRLAEAYEIRQDNPFMQWRFVENPIDGKQKVLVVQNGGHRVAKFWCMIKPSGVIFIEHRIFFSDSATECAQALIALKNHFSSKGSIVCDWTFPLSSDNTFYMNVLKQAGFMHLTHGISFVFHPLDSSIQAADLKLTRLSTEGV